MGRARGCVHQYDLVRSQTVADAVEFVSDLGPCHDVSVGPVADVESDAGSEDQSSGNSSTVAAGRPPSMVGW